MPNSRYVELKRKCKYNVFSIKPRTSHTGATLSRLFCICNRRRLLSIYCILNDKSRTLTDGSSNVQILLCWVWWGRQPHVTAYLRRHLPVVHPAQRGEVGRLGAVEAVVETGVVAVRKGDHKLPFVLGYLLTRSRGQLWRRAIITCPATPLTLYDGRSHPVEWNAVLFQDRWRNQCHLVPEESITALGASGKEAWRQQQCKSFGVNLIIKQWAQTVMSLKKQ